MSFEKFIKRVYRFFDSLNLWEDLPDSVVFVDQSGYVIKANERAASSFGLTYNVENPVHIDSIIDNGVNLIHSSAELKSPAVSSAKISGEEIPVELNAVKKKDYFCVVIRDNSKMTKDITASAKISMLNKEKNEMIVKLENEFTSALTSITGFSKGLLDGIAGPLAEKQEKYLKIINSNSVELYDFMSKFVEFSYSESSLCSVNLHKFDVIETIKNVMKEFDAITKEKKIDFSLDYGILEKRTIFSDSEALKKILHNIIDVSIKNTEVGHIEIQLGLPNEQDFLNFGLKENKSYLKIVISDTGKGFESSDMKKICDPYAQVSKSKKEIIQSFKLGTASILVKRLDGNINIASQSLEGTVYNIVIPS